MAKKVLIVDDIVYARKIIKEILVKAKYTVVGEASNGNEAISLNAQLKPDIIIMDIIMPIKGGVEATRRILEDNKDVRVIILSAISHEQFMMEAINAGACDFILKPFEPMDLIRAVDKAVSSGDSANSLKTTA